jgi:hypothetical protein
VAGRRDRVTAWAAARRRARDVDAGWKGVSAWHLWWDVPRAADPVVAVSAVLEILEEPHDEHLWFWALQASFTDGTGRHHGAAHLGLQRFAPAPDHRAANWGGYGSPPAGDELDGTEPTLPAFSANVNTRTYPWRAGVPYELRIRRGEVGWAGEIAEAGGGPVVLRELLAGGDRLTSPVVWAEIFAPCSAAPTTVRWSRCTAWSAEGEGHPVRSVRVTIPGAGNCPNTDVDVDDVGLLQRTGVDRRHRDGARLHVPGV